MIKIENFPVARWVTGEVVTAIHAALQALGFELPPAETSTSSYGEWTSEAVRTFQQRQGLPPTGDVDGPTFAALQSAARAVPSGQRSRAEAPSPVSVRIDQPRANASFDAGQSVTVRVTAEVATDHAPGDGWGPGTITAVSITVGTTELTVNTDGDGRYTATGVIPTAYPTLDIVATATARNDAGDSLPAGKDQVRISITDKLAPDVTLDLPATISAPTRRSVLRARRRSRETVARVEIGGTAEDQQSGVARVEWSLDGGPFHDARLGPLESGHATLRDWRAEVVIPHNDQPSSTHSITVRATDNVGNESALQRSVITVIVSDVVMRQYVDRLRDLAARMQDLWGVLSDVQSGKQSLKMNDACIRDAVAEIDRRTQDVQADTAIQYFDDRRDAIPHVQDIWGQMRRCPLLVDPAQDVDAHTQQQFLSTLDTQCQQIMYHLGRLTIPDQLNEWLANARPGYYLPFHTVFSGDVPNQDDRVRILSYLAWSPHTIRGGLVDAGSGLIYRYASSRWRRALSLVFLLAAVAMATAAIPVACHLPVTNWPLQAADQLTLLMGWGALLAGVVMHVAISTAKRMQTQSGFPPVLALSDAFRLINAKTGQILLKLVLAVFALFSFTFAAGVAHVSALNFFLAGYALDSVTELFGATIEQRAATQVSTLRQQLGIPVQQ